MLGLYNLLSPALLSSLCCPFLYTLCLHSPFQFFTFFSFQHNKPSLFLSSSPAPSLYPSHFLYSTQHIKSYPLFTFLFIFLSPLMCFIIFTSPLASLLSFLFNVAGLGLYIPSSLLDVFSFTLLTCHLPSLIPLFLPCLLFHVLSIFLSSKYSESKYSKHAAYRT